MYYHFDIAMSHLPSPDPEARALGCGGSIDEGFNCETEKQAIWLMQKKHPQSKGYYAIIRCKALDLERQIVL